MTEPSHKLFKTSSLVLLKKKSTAESELGSNSFSESFGTTSFFQWIFPYLLILIELVCGLFLGFVFVAIGAGAGASILSGIAAGALVAYFYKIFFKKQIKPNTQFRKIGQAIVGLTIGISLSHSHLLNIGFQLPIFLLTTLFLLGSSFLIGHVYSRIGKVDLFSAMLAVVPGNIGIMASLAADYGRNVSLVSLVQLIRFTGIILLVPLVANVSTPHDVGAIISSLTQDLFRLNPSYLLQLSCVLTITFFAARLGSRWKVPAAYFFCPIIVGTLLNATLSQLPVTPALDFSLPALVNLMGQTLLGVTIGEYWGVNPILRKRTVAYASIPVALTFLAGFLAAGLTMFVTHWDWLTCLLVVSPGGSPEMILIALVLHHNVETITAAHLVRLLLINLYLPALVWIFEKSEIGNLESQLTKA